MRGRKGTTFEGGLRVPFLIRYPKQIPAGSRVDRIAGAIDLLPTLADLAGIELRSKKPIDGISIAPWLRGDDKTAAERLLFSAWNKKASVRSQRFRMQADGTLYDLETDPGETTDVADSHPEVTRRLGAALRAWLDETQPKPSQSAPTRPITVGHPEERQTQLPARDAQPRGSVVRSNRFPNCTYMTHWTTAPEDEITWDVEVLEGGAFEVQMYYACAQESVGSELELRFGDQRLQATIDQANDVPAMGSEHDRVERQESYVKAWRPMKLGVIQLPSGRGTLTLRALRSDAEQVADMRLLLLRRVAS
jgi:hypothetical protein